MTAAAQGIDIRDLPLPPEAETVLTCGALPEGALDRLVRRHELRLEWVPDRAGIPGSFWGDREAGIRGHTLFVRADTPVHSALHEFCHLLCMDSARRRRVDTDAGGDFLEEDAVCCLQVLLADYLPGMGRERMFRDMDAWGYSFRLGSAHAWFEEDAAEARQWLQKQGLVDEEGRPTFRARS